MTSTAGGDANGRIQQLRLREVLTLSWLLYVFVSAYQVAPASVLPIVGRDLGVGPAAVSWVTSALFVSVALAAIPVGVWIDRTDVRRIVLVGGVVVFAATLWTWRAGVQGEYAAVLASRVVAGVGVIALWSACITLVGDLADSHQHGTAVSVFATSVPFGLAVGQFGTPLLTARVGWAASLPLLGVGALLPAIGVWAGSPPRPNANATAAPRTEEITCVLGRRDVLGVGTLGFIAISLLFIINNWMPSYLQHRYALSASASGLLTATFSAVGVLSRALSGVLSDRLLGARRKPLVVVSFLVSTPLLVGLAVVDSLVATVALLVVAGYFGQVGHVLLFVYTRELVPSTLVGTSLSVLNTIGFLGAVSAPVLTGVLIERTGTFLSAFVYAGVLGVAAVVVAVRMPESATV